MLKVHDKAAIEPKRNPGKEQKLSSFVGMTNKKKKKRKGDGRE